MTEKGHILFGNCSAIHCGKNYERRLIMEKKEFIRLTKRGILFNIYLNTSVSNFHIFLKIG